MKINYLVSSLCALLLVLGCTKEEADLRVPEFEIPVIHGYYVRDGTGSFMGSYGYGKPNVRLGDVPDYWQSNYFFVIYPNPPVLNTLYVLTKSPSHNNVKKLWITHAVLRPPFDPGVVPQDGRNNFVAGGAPLFEVEFTQEEIRLDLTELDDGYYRVYVKINNQVLYDNLVVNRQFYPF